MLKFINFPPASSQSELPCEKFNVKNVDADRLVGGKQGRMNESAGR